MTGGFGVASFHAVAVGQASKNLVCVFELASTAIGKTKNELWQADDRPNRRVRISLTSDEREVARGRILTRHRQSVWIHEMRMGRAEFAGALVHQRGECFDAAALSRAKHRATSFGLFTSKARSK